MKQKTVSNSIVYRDYVKVGMPASLIDDFIEEWHHSDSDQKLHEFLGLTTEQYSLFIKDHHKFFEELEAQSQIKS